MLEPQAVRPGSFLPSHNGGVRNGVLSMSNVSLGSFVARGLIAVSALAFAATAQAQFSYNTNNGGITITGYTGSCGPNHGGPLGGCTVTVPCTINGLPVTSIGDSAFADATNVNEIILPDNLANIGSSAFSNCVWMDGIVMPANLPHIDDYAFWQCFELTGITIPNGVTNIGVSAFYGCASLTTIQLPNSVTGIGDSAFEFCQQLANCGLGTGLTNIGSSAFGSCPSLVSVTLPAGVSNIGSYAFSYCSGLASVYFAGSAPTLDSTVFYGDNNVIAYYALGTSGWPLSLTGYPMGLWDPQIPCTLTTNDSAVTIISYLGSGGTVNVPGSIAGLPVTTIGTNAFAGFAGLTNVTVGANVTNLGSGAFAGDSALNALFFQGNAPSAEPDVFTNIADATVYYLAGTTGWGPAFGGLPTMVWDAADQLGWNTNAGGGVTILRYLGTGGALTIPATIAGLAVMAFGNGVFQGRTNLTSLALPDSVNSLGAATFEG